jgi:hypothetical protein
MNNQIIHQTRTKFHQEQETSRDWKRRALSMFVGLLVCFYSHTQVLGADVLDGPEHMLVYPIAPLM